MIRDLPAYREGNVGIDYLRSFESGRAGPHVLINALAHGNEFCGVAATTHLLHSVVRSLCGTSMVSFAKVEARGSFNAVPPFESRQLIRNMNSVWSDEWMCGSVDSPELGRARALRPVVAVADAVLGLPKLQTQRPSSHRDRPAKGLYVVMQSGLGSGMPRLAWHDGGPWGVDGGRVRGAFQPRHE